MIEKLTFGRKKLLTAFLGILLVLSLFQLPVAGAEDPVTIDEISVSKQNAYPGETIRATITWTNTTNYDVAATVSFTGGTTNYSKPVNLGPSGSVRVDFPIDYSVSPGNYDVTVKTGKRVLQKLSNAFTVHGTAGHGIIELDLTSPVKSDPRVVEPGDSLTVNYKYEAVSDAPVYISLSRGGGYPPALKEVTLAKDKTSGSTVLNIPRNAEPGKYSLTVTPKAGGDALDTEQDAVIVDAKVTADITSPTKSDSSTVKGGGSLKVKFNYTSNGASEVAVNIVKSNGKVLASASASLDKTAAWKNKSVSVSIPASAAIGKYDVEIVSKYSGKELDTQSQAVIVEDPVTVKIQSPTADKPVRFNDDGRVEIKFNYTAAVSDSVEFRLLKPDGKALASKTVSLSKTSGSKAGSVTINLPRGTDVAKYDLEVRNKDTGNRIALESDAVTVVDYPLDMQVKFIVGQNGRWVNGVFQPTDLNVRIIENRTLLPIRHVGEPLGWELEWDDRNKMATVIKGEMQVRVWLGNSNGSISTNNGKSWKTVKIDRDNASVQPLIISGRVLLPLRFISESLDTRVDWDSASRTVTVTQ